MDTLPVTGGRQALGAPEKAQGLHSVYYGYITSSYTVVIQLLATVWSVRVSAAKSRSGQECGPSVQTRRLGCAQTGNRAVRSVQLSKALPLLPWGFADTGGAEEKTSGISEPGNPQSLPTSRRRSPVDKWASEATPP